MTTGRTKKRLLAIMIASLMAQCIVIWMNTSHGHIVGALIVSTSALYTMFVIGQVLDNG